MDDLATWLRGVLDEDEAQVRDSRMPSGEAPYDEPVWWLPDWLTKKALLADIEAKRAILDEIVPALEGYEWDAVAERSTTERLVRLLASAYKDRPGYRDEWRP